ncbi:MAG TPA: DUF2155 domain-containing protein [Xanthobacteraceae bacterium]|nr:DUF2155 domain-containing protein [Xanthobacteraceae bacterium]
MVRIAALVVVVGGIFAAGSAAAQFGNPFGEPPPRPPADVPNGPFPPQPPPAQYPGQYPAPQQPGQYPSPQQYPPAQPYSPPQSAARSPSGIQAQPLPPPPGATQAPPQNPQGAPRVAPAPPAQPPSPQPADATPQEEDTVVTETPTKKIENNRAVFAGLDKITGRTISFDAAIGETASFGALRVTARACYTRPPTEATNTDAFVEVDEITLQGEIKRIFTGWMFASSPGLHAVEHPIYDVWLTNCAQPMGGSVAQSAPPAPPAANPQTAPGRKPASPRAPVVPPSNAPAPVTDD